MNFLGAQVAQVSLSGAQKFLNSQALQDTDAVITGTTDFSNAGGKISAKGSLNNASLRRVSRARKQAVISGSPGSSALPIEACKSSCSVRVGPPQFAIPRVENYRPPLPTPPTGHQSRLVPTSPPEAARAPAHVAADKP